MKPWQQIRRMRNKTAYVRMRKRFLAENPVCKMCKREAAVELDHITPAIKAIDRFWELDNLQGLCKPCHEIKSAEEKRNADGGWAAYMEATWA